jgi:hypothetical protein
MRPVYPDPTIDEIREIRHRISERFGHDPRKLVEYYMEEQKKYADPLVNLADVPVEPEPQREQEKPA